MLVEHGVGGAPGVPQRFQRRDVLLEAGKGVEQAAVGRGIDQRALVMLAVDFDQRGADRLQGLHADRLIVDEGAGAAVGELHAAQDHLAGIVGLASSSPFSLRIFAAGWPFGTSNTAVTWPCSTP